MWRRTYSSSSRRRVVPLKGPALARWLYADEPALRPNSDVDLIVSPADTDRAQALLRELRFRWLSHLALESHVSLVILSSSRPLRSWRPRPPLGEGLPC